jgi:uncharacterized membrane protein
MVSSIGMLLYFILAIVGGFMTGLFSRYSYQLARQSFGASIALLLSGVFYVAPGWAIFSLFKDDDLDVFYILLIVSFMAGIYTHKKLFLSEPSREQSYSPDDDEF